MIHRFTFKRSVANWAKADSEVSSPPSGTAEVAELEASDIERYSWYLWLSGLEVAAFEDLRVDVHESMYLGDNGQRLMRSEAVRPSRMNTHVCVSRALLDSEDPRCGRGCASVFDMVVSACLADSQARVGTRRGGMGSQWDSKTFRRS